MAQVLNYPDWIYLPDRIETEIRYLFQNCEKEHLIHKLSMFLQTPWDKHFNQLKNDQVSSMNNSLMVGPELPNLIHSISGTWATLRCIFDVIHL